MTRVGPKNIPHHLRSEFEEVNGLALKYHQIGDGRILLTTHQSREQLLIPQPLDANEVVQ